MIGIASQPPEFAEQLSETPPYERTAYVFNPKSIEGMERLSMNWVFKLIVRMGELAGVKVAERTRLAIGEERGTETKIKYASANDFRRAFGFRWAMRVMSRVLMEMKRHEASGPQWILRRTESRGGRPRNVAGVC